MKGICLSSVSVTILCAVFLLDGCGGGKSKLLVSVNPSTAQTIDEGQSKTFTAFVINDATNAGVTWSVSGASCKGSACGTLTNVASTSATYNAPTGLTTTLSATVTATANADKTVNAPVSISVVLPPSITTTSLPNGTNGTPYNQTVGETGGVPPLSFSIVPGSGSLPLDLTLSISGTISGRPGGSGTSSFTVQVADSGNPPLTAMQPLSITINPPPALSITTTSLPNGPLGSPYNAALTAAGGVLPLTWSIPSGTLPGGLTLNTSTGQISGIPTAKGTFSFTAEVMDSAIPPQAAAKSLSITIGPPAPLTINTTSLPGGTTATVYSAQLAASGGVPPLTWSISSGLLPSGLTLNASTGLISGTPNTQGTFTFTVEVADSESPPMTATQQFSVVIAAGTSNDSLLEGNYVFLFNGFDSAGNVVIAGRFTADGMGNLTNGIEDVNRSSGVTPGVSFSGTYTMGASGEGSISITANSTTFIYHLALDTNGNARFIEFDSTGIHGAGIIKKQQSSSFTTADFLGNYAFGFSGADAAGKRAVIAGAFHADGSGNLSQGNADVNDAGAVDANLTGGSGTYSVSSNGRGNAIISLPVPATFNFSFYMVSPSDIFFVGSDPISPTNPRASGEALLQTSPFTAASLNGSSIATGSGLDTAGASVFAGLLTGSGSGSATLTSDQNDAGTITSDFSQTGSYAVASNGRVAFTGMGTRLAVLYLVSQNQGFLAGTDTAATSGILEPQLGGPSFTNGSLSGSFALHGPSPAENQVTSVVGALTADGAGNITGVVDSVTSSGAQGSNQTLTATYLVTPNGRGTISTNAPPGVPAQIVFYLVSPAEVRLVSSGPTDTHPQLIFFDH